MAFNSSNNNSGSVFNMAYSAFLGGMYMSTQENDSAIDSAKALVGEDAVKKGFTGAQGATAEARKFLKDKNVSFGNITGKLVHANLRQSEKDGRKYSYVNVCLKDGSDLYCVSVPAGHESGQMLVRKLANAKFGEETTLSLFAVMEKSENPAMNGREFAKHIASLKQGGNEVQGVSPAPIKALADAQVAKLKEAGVEDAEVIKKSRAGVANTFHIGLWTDIDAHVAAYKAARGEGAPAPADSTSDATAPAPGFDDMDQDIPF